MEPKLRSLLLQLRMPLEYLKEEYIEYMVLCFKQRNQNLNNTELVEIPQGEDIVRFIKARRISRLDHNESMPQGRSER